MDYYTECSLDCNRCPEAIADMTAQCTIGRQVEVQHFYVITVCYRFCTIINHVILVHLLTLLWLETRQCSHTFTRCSKQNKLVTFLFGHLQRPIATCAGLKRKQTNAGLLWMYAKKKNLLISHPSVTTNCKGVNSRREPLFHGKSM